MSVIHGPERPNCDRLLGDQPEGMPLIAGPAEGAFKQN